MNIAAIKAYSTAAGVRPTLPVRNTITDSFDGNGRSTVQKITDTDDKNKPMGGSSSFTLFNASGRIEMVSAGIKGGIFDGKA